MNFDNVGSPLARVVLNPNASFLNPNPKKCEHCEREFTTPQSCKAHVPRCKAFSDSHVLYGAVDYAEGFDEFQCDPGEKLQILPSDKERECILVTGQAGSGKSFFTGQYMLQYKKKHPRNPIILFSALNEDPTLARTKVKIKRVKLDQDFVNSDVPIDWLKNSLCVFDDVDCLPNKKIKDKVNKILDGLLQVGRHFKTTVIVCNHAAARGKDTKILLNESNRFVIFPRTSGNRSIKYLLDNFVGMDPQEIRDVKRLKSRWVCINRGYPMRVIHESGAYTLNVAE